jgi:hypothetical protein
MKPRMLLGSRITRGFTVTDLLFAILFLAVLAALLLPALPSGHHYSARIMCALNLKQIGLSFDTFALDNNDHYPMRVAVANGGCQDILLGGSHSSNVGSLVFRCMSNELSTPKILVCPDDWKRSYVTNFLSLDDKAISYFVGLDAVEKSSSSWLSGDRHLSSRVTPGSAFLILSTNSVLGWTKEMHSGAGNICFANGSVRGLTNASLRVAIQALGDATNRLAIP